MPVIRTIKRTLTVFGHLPKKYYFIAAMVSLAAIYIAVFREQTISLSYDGSTCQDRIVALPDLHHQPSDSGYNVDTKGGLTLGGVRLLSTSICITPLVSPTENAADHIVYAPFGGWFAASRFKIQTGEHPSVDTTVLTSAIPVSRPLSLPLTVPNELFRYKVSAGDKEAACDSDASELICDLPELELKQSRRYTLAFSKYFGDDIVGKPVSATIETLSPLSVKSSSIKQKATVYNAPKTLTLTADKPIDKAEFSLHRIDGDKTDVVAISTHIKDKTAIITFDDKLPRKATYRLDATQLEAGDGSTTLDPYRLTFSTSGGPKVSGINVGSTGIASGTTIAVTFDQTLDQNQDISRFIATAGGVRYQGRQGNQLYFDTSQVARCATMKIAFTKDIKSKYGFSGDSAWSYSGRSRCYTVSTIGYSRQGRPINAYTFGGTGRTVLYVGAIHGNEPSSKYILDDWIAELDANPGRIPPGRQVVVVPSLNPDGVATGSRNNSAGVNLDRNFPTDDWKSDINSADGYRKGGGGSKPLSEPESQAIASLVQRLRPYLMLSYHSQGSLVMGDPGVYSETYAARYATMVGYRDATRASSESLFGYDGSSGLFEGWAYLKVGVPNIVVELNDHYSRQFVYHREAFWAMLR